MTADIVNINFNDEFKDVIRSLEGARKEFLTASESYDLAGRRFQNLAIEELERLGDPASGRAAQIQDCARATIMDIRDFARTHAELTTGVMNLLMTFNQKVISYTLEMIPVSVFETPADSNLSAIENVHLYIENLDVKQQENAALAATAILLGRQVADAVRAATQPITTRQGTLELAVRELIPRCSPPPAGIGQVTPIACEAAAPELRLTILEEILKQAALELGTHIPIAGIVLSIARVASDVRARQTALKERYDLQVRIVDAQSQRGPIDAMFDLPAQLQDEERITEGVIYLLAQLIDVTLGKIVPLTARRRLRMLAEGVDHVDDADDDPDQGHQHEGGDARRPLEHDRGHRQRDQHGPDSQQQGLPGRGVGPVGPEGAPLGPVRAPGPAALVPAPRVPI
jgi:hypothetical protein